jgi:hypothetical protein
MACDEKGYIFFLRFHSFDFVKQDAFCYLLCTAVNTCKERASELGIL